MILQFDVINQRIIRTDKNYIVANSQFYLQMDFNFTYDWQGFAKTITFVSGTKKFSIGLNAQDSCIVPWEVIKSPSFLFSIRGELDDVVITTNVVTIPIVASGETKGISPTDPPKEIYSGLQNGLTGQILSKLTNDNYDYTWVNLENTLYDGTLTLKEKIDEIEEGLAEIGYDEETHMLYQIVKEIRYDIVSMYDKDEIDNKVQEINGDITNLQNNLSNETSAREQADTTLQGNIDTLDTRLTNSINEEKNARELAISNEASAREQADGVLQGNINSEELARQQADTTLQGNIDAEARARNESDITIQGNIDNEVSAREQAITQEANARSDNDATLQRNINSEAQARQNADSTLQGNIDSEALARGNADTTLQGNIDTEALARGNADDALQSDINTHKNNKNNPHEVNKTQVGLGNVANTGDSATPSENGTEKFTTGGAYTLKSELHQEVVDEATARQNQDGVLQGNIDAEALTRGNQDGILQGNIDAEALSRQQADATLQGNINTKVGETTITNQLITNWFINEDQKFSNYAYVSNTTIQALIGAKYVNVSFSLSQLEMNLICPIQVVDTDLGILSIYANDNEDLTIPYIYIFK